MTESHPPPVPMPSVRPLSFMDRVKRSPLPYAGGVVGLIVALFVLRSVLKRRSANAAEAVAAEAAEASAAAAPPGADEPISAEFSLTTETEGPDFFGQMGTEAAPSAGGTSYGDTEPLMSALQGASAQDGLLQTADVSPPTPISLEGVGASGMPESEQFVSADFSEVEAVAGEPPVSADGGVATGEEEGETRVDFGDFFARMGQASGGEEVKPVEDEPPELSSQVFAEQFHGVFLSPEDADSAPAPDSSEMTLPTDDEALDPFSLNGQTAQSEEFDETLFSSQEKTQAHVDLDDTFFHSASQTRAERPAPASPPSSGSADFVVSLDDEMTSSPVGMPIVGGGSGEGSPEAEDAAAGEETLVLSNPDAVARMGLDPAIQERLLSDEQQNLYEDNHRRGCRAFEEHDYHTALKHFRIAQTLRPDNADVANRLAIVQKALRSADTH
ncbi:hypothetical protein JW916_13840 [Candidatus Sumerlaeota bacterium]|nr:hypothetical protein [Candidatus Sumerlaeota bacterium]